VSTGKGSKPSDLNAYQIPPVLQVDVDVAVNVNVNVVVIIRNDDSSTRAVIQIVGEHALLRRTQDGPTAAHR